MTEIDVITGQNTSTEIPAGGGPPLQSQENVIKNTPESSKPDMEETSVDIKSTETVSTGVSLEENAGVQEDKHKEQEVELKNSESSNRIIPQHKAPIKKGSFAVTERQQELWGYWYQPEIANTSIRSKTYLTSRLKIRNGAPPLLDLTHFSFLNIKERVDNVGSHKNSWLNRGCPEELKNRRFLIINIQITSMNVMLVQYFVFNEQGLTGCKRVNKMFDEFVRGSNEFRDKRLKLIPVIVEGPWLVRNSVPTRPCIIGTKVKNRYAKGANYFEVDIEADFSYIAKGVLSLLQGYNNYSVNLIWILEAVTTEELPERILAAAHLGYPNYKKAISLESP